MTEDKPETTHSTNEAPAKKGFFKKWWWLILLIFLIVAAAVVVPVVILVAVPKIAQQKLDAAQLTIDGIAVTNGRANSYTMAINSTITTDGSVHANIDPFEGDMYLEDVEPHKPFATLNFPQTTSDAHQVVNVTQDIQITDMDTFIQFNQYILHNDTVRVTVNGDTFVQVRGISRKYAVTFKKTIDLTGLQGLKSLNVTNNTISLTADARGDNFYGTATLQNPSVLTLDLGNTSFNNYLEGNSVGTVFVDNLVLRPGDNNLNLRANISQGPVLTALTRRPYCETGVLPLVLSGKDVVNNGDRLAYFADALASNNQTTNVDVGSSLRRDLKLDIKCI